jgi:hypothetical protein
MNRKDILSFSNTLVFCLSIYAFLSKTISIWSLSGPLIYHFPAIAAILLILSIVLKYTYGLDLSPWAFLAWLWILFFSDWIDRPYNFFQGTNNRGEILLFSLLTLVLVRKKLFEVFNFLPLLGLIICCYSFLSQSGGRLIFSDDHTVFQFRFEMLKGNFPAIPFYYPLWNGGFDARDFFATGSLSVFSIFSPLIYSFPVEKVYNLIIILLLFVLHPFLIYVAAKIHRIPSPGPAIASALSLALSLSWYRWALQYGTLGFITSCALMPLNLVCLSLIFDDDEKLSAKLAVMFIVSFSLMLFWSLSGLVFVPAIFLAILNFKKLILKKNVLATALVLLALNTPWVISFWTVSNVSKFVTEGGNIRNQSEVQIAEEPDAPKSIFDSFQNYYKRAFRIIRENTITVNPLLLTLGLLGLVTNRPREKKLFGFTAIWLIFLCMFASPIFPRLELDRMMVLLAALLTLSTAKCIIDFFKLCEEGDYLPAKKILFSLAGGFLITSQFVAGTIVSNRSLMHYYFEDKEVDKVAQDITANNSGGRVLFSGFVLHDLSNGHLAPLTYRTNVPLMASSHVHNMWKYTQIIPAYFINKGDSGVENYFDLYNVSAVFAHERYWINYFRDRDHLYSEIDASGKFKMFKRNNFKNTFFVEGRGELLSESSNTITIKALSPNLVLSFNYYDFLEASACEIKQKIYGDDVKLISLENCPPDATVVIKSKPVYKRVLNKL